MTKNGEVSVVCVVLNLISVSMVIVLSLVVPLMLLLLSLFRKYLSIVSRERVFVCISVRSLIALYSFFSLRIICSFNATILSR